MSSRLPLSRTLALAALTLLLSCQDSSVTDPAAGGGPGEAPAAAAPEASGALADLGRGLAIALDEAPMRQQVLEAMRDSPFPEHSLHLQSYLASGEGRRLLEGAAREIGIAPGELLDRLEARPDLQLFMPNSYQRGTWEGEGPVAVAATADLEAAVASGRVPAWTSGGEAVGIPLSERLRLPTLAVFPARHDFGDDAAARLRGAQERDRPTVGRKGVLPVHGAATLPDGAAAELETAAVADGGGFAPGEGSLNDWMDWGSCRVASNDYDDDGLVDSCESALAQTFRPRLVFGVEEGLESRETHWAVRVQDFSERRVFVFYALSYHDDSGHIGDSEWIQLRIGWENDRWKLNYADYSAHFGGVNDHSETFHYSSLDFVGNRLRGRPVAYVAEGKHAAYGSIAECDDNLDNFTIDDCNWGFVEPAGADASRNLGNNHGSTTVLEDCVGSEGSASDGHSTSFGTECYWTDRNFRGWHGTSTGAMPYGDVLAYFGWNTNPIDNDGDGSDSGDGDCDLRTARKRC